MRIPYVGAWILAAACVMVILFMASTSSKALDGILYEELTCEELVFGYEFNRDVIDGMLTYHDGCMAYIDPEVSGHDHGDLGCRFLREHGLFVQGIVNDIAAVYNIKCAYK